MSYSFNNENQEQGKFFHFGLNSEVFLKNFELVTEDNSNYLLLEFENREGAKMNKRYYEVTQVFTKEGTITDPEHEAFKKAIADLSNTITHIMLAFVDEETLKNALANPINSFTAYIEILKALLPKDYQEQPIDVFMQYQWTLKEGQTSTFLELPRTKRYGSFICRSIEHKGNWKTIAKENPNDNDREALYYEDEEGNKHRFTRNGWFMNSNFAVRQTVNNQQSSQQKPEEDNGVKPLPF